MEFRQEIFKTILLLLDDVNNKSISEEINIFDVGRFLKIISEKIKDIENNIDTIEKKEFEKYLPDELKNIGVAMSGGGYSYKFDHIDVWKKKNKELKDIEDQAKKKFQLINKQTIEIDKETGEVIEDNIEIEAAIATPRKRSVSYKIK